jgi:hypothetical protein
MASILIISLSVATAFIMVLGFWGMRQVRQINEQNRLSIAELSPKKVFGGYQVFLGSTVIGLIEGKRNSQGVNVRLSLSGQFPVRMIAYKKASGVFHPHWLHMACRHRNEFVLGRNTFVIKTDSPAAIDASGHVFKNNLLSHLLREDGDALYVSRTNAAVFFSSYKRFWGDSVPLIEGSMELFNHLGQMQNLQGSP